MRVVGALKARIARVFRRYLPDTDVWVRHIEKDLWLRVNLRRHVHIWLRGARRYEPQYVKVLREEIREGDIVYDVGANIGFYTLLFSRWVGTSGLVVAFEPDPDNLRLLEENLRQSGCRNVAVHPVAIGHRKGVADFSRDLVTGGSGRLGQVVTHAHGTLGNGQVYLMPVEVDCIDHLVQHGLRPPNVLKLDIEGGEGNALRGATWTIATYRPIIVTELSDPRPVVTQLRASGYHIQDLDSGRWLGVDQWAWMVRGVPARSSTADARQGAQKPKD